MMYPKVCLVSMMTVLGISNGQVYDVRNTTNGAVQGLLNETNFCRSWRGVFYAADAGGSNRWQAPQPRASWAPNVADATAFGAGCLQIHHNPDVPTNQSEDCLNLNVFAPDYCMGNDLASCALPVLIWYHGGTFLEGWSEGPFDLYDGCNFAHGGDVIVVTANYRLGAMGFLVTNGDGDDDNSISSSGSSGSEYALRGNQGMLDQKAAMEWVRDNIANFGGDPNLVTIFGQSAGSMSVGLHHTSPEMYSSGLFKRVIMVRWKTFQEVCGTMFYSLEITSPLFVIGVSAFIISISPLFFSPFIGVQLSGVEHSHHRGSVRAGEPLLRVAGMLATQHPRLRHGVHGFQAVRRAH